MHSEPFLTSVFHFISFYFFVWLYYWEDLAQLRHIYYMGYPSSGNLL